MTVNSRPLAAVAAFSGGFGLLLCAFAAHGVDDPDRSLWLRIGGFCMVMHSGMAIATLALIRNRLGTLTALLFLLGALVFGGTLGAMTFGAPRWLGAVTPLGGLGMLAGWAMLGIAFLLPPRPGATKD